MICFDYERADSIQAITLKVDKIDNVLLCYLRLLIQTESMFQDDAAPDSDGADNESDKQTKHSSTNTSMQSSSAASTPAESDANPDDMNFTKVIDLDQERKVLELYKKILIFVLRKTEAITTLEYDLQLLCSEDQLTDWQMRFAVIYRSERKKILHSQLHLITWLLHVINVCDQGPGRDELSYYFKFITFGKTEFEEQLLSNKDLSEKQQTKHEEDYFLRRIFAGDYLKDIYELVATKI